MKAPRLEEEIALAEQRTAANKMLARAHYEQFKHDTAEKLRKPKTLGLLFGGGVILGFLLGGKRVVIADSAVPATSRRALRFDQITQLISTLTRASVILTPLLKWFQTHKTTVTKTTEPPSDAPTTEPIVEKTVIKES